MRRSGSFPKKRKIDQPSGFTLLELVLALVCSGLLVAVLVTIWIQVIRTTTASSLESATQVQKQALQRHLHRVVSTVQWTPTSHLPRGVMPWESSDDAFVLWSRESFGDSPGPVRWTFQLRNGAWTGQWEDPTPAAEGARQGGLPLPGVAELHLEILEQAVGPWGERVQWTDFRNWDPVRPFRPLGFRFRLKWTDDIQAIFLTSSP